MVLASVKSDHRHHLVPGKVNHLHRDALRAHQVPRETRRCPARWQCVTVLLRMFFDNLRTDLTQCFFHFMLQRLRFDAARF